MRWLGMIRLGSLLDGLFPVRCVGCGAPPDALCPSCLAAARPAGPGSGAPRRFPAGPDWTAAVLAYEGAVREALARVKYRNGRSALPILGTALVRHLQAELPAPVDVVTWPPTTAARSRARAFDQAEHLARMVGRGLGVPVGACLIRRPGPAQTGRSAAARRAGPDLAPGPVPVAGRRVLVVDDVTTTGATLAAAARVLRAAGAAWIGAATVARTPHRKMRPGDGCGSIAAGSSPHFRGPLFAVNRGPVSGRGPPRKERKDR